MKMTSSASQPRRLLALASLLLLPLAAQTAAPTPASATASSKEEVVVLTPFTVDATLDRGFVATSSLAGGRIASDLRDTPVAYSVLTGEFLDALSITNLIDATRWTVNNDTLLDYGVGLAFGQDVALSIRGISTGGAQSNFFPIRWDADGYNVERMDFARGPNSILFGAGGIGGFANSMTKQARTDRPFTEVRAMIGSFDYRRGTVDLNRPLVTNKLALRLNLLWSDKNTWRDQEFDRRTGADLAITWKPSRNTAVRAEAQTGVVYKNQGFNVLQDSFSGWDGVSTYSAPLLTSPANNNALGVNRNGSPIYIFQPNLASLGIVNYQNAAVTMVANANANVPVNGVLVPGPLGSFSGAPILGSVGLPFLFDRAIAGSSFRMPPTSFTMAPNSGPGSNAARFQVYTITTNQQVGENWFLEAAFNYVPTTRNSDVTANRGLANVSIDINRNLPTGAPNPNFLVPYQESNIFRQFQSATSRSWRLGAAAVYDKTRWGDFKFNALVGQNNTLGFTEVVTESLRLTTNKALWYNQNNLRFRYYWNSPSQPEPWLAGTNVSVVDPVTGTTSSVPVDANSNSPGNNLLSTTYTFAQAAGTAKFFRGRLVLLGAARRDDYDLNTKNGLAFGDYGADWNGYATAWRPAAPANWTKLTYTPKNAAGVTTGPLQPAATRPRNADQSRQVQYANDVFQDDFSNPRVKGGITTFSAGGVFHITRMLSPFANYAETFSPQTGAITIDGSILPPTSSQGWDYGLRFALLDSKLNVSIGRYKSTQTGVSAGTGTGNGFAVPLPNAIAAIQQTNVIGDLTPSGVNARGMQPVILTFVDTRDLLAQGYELEVVANPTRNWRISANLSLPEVYQQNAYPTLRKYLAENDTLFRNILKDAGVIVGSNGLASVDLTVPADVRSPDANNAATQYNALQAATASMIAGKQKTTRNGKYNANIFTDYTISSGPMKDVRIGGGVNYRGPQVIGYKGGDTIVDPANPATTIDDPTRSATDVVYGPSYKSATLTLGYTIKAIKRYPVRLDLKIDNLFDTQPFIYYNATLKVKGGSLTTPARETVPYQYMFITPRNWNLTASVRF
jgi:outer membrane receptor protein involved in Fe transport